MHYSRFFFHFSVIFQQNTKMWKISSKFFSYARTDEEFDKDNWNTSALQLLASLQIFINHYLRVAGIITRNLFCGFLHNAGTVHEHVQGTPTDEARTVPAGRGRLGRERRPVDTPECAWVPRRRMTWAAPCTSHQLPFPVHTITILWYISQSNLSRELDSYLQLALSCRKDWSMNMKSCCFRCFLRRTAQHWSRVDQ